MKYVIIFSLVLFSFTGYAQKLSLNELLKFQNYSLSDINYHLLSKSWTLIESYDEENIKEEHVNGTVWTLTNGKWDFIYNDNSIARLTYGHSYDSEGSKIPFFKENRYVIYLTTNSNYFIEIKKELTSMGFNKYKEYSQDNIIQTFYEYKGIGIVLTVIAKDGANTFRIHILDKKD